MDEIKVLLQSLVDKALCAKNEKDEDEEEEYKKAEAENVSDDTRCRNKKACNEDVDKRDIIRQIMAIAGKEEASEDVKTIAKLTEKLAYDKSEAGTADNEEYEDMREKKKISNDISRYTLLQINILYVIIVTKVGSFVIWRFVFALFLRKLYLWLVVCQFYIVK